MNVHVVLVCYVMCVMLCVCVCVKGKENKEMEWTTASSSICVSHSADVPLELHEGVCDEEVVLGGLAALQHHHECRGGAQRVGGRARDTGMDWGGRGGRGGGGA